MEAPYLTSEEVLEKAEKIGLELAERKLKYYVTLGIIPKPIRNPEDKSKVYDGRVAYFPHEVVDRLNKIKDLQDSGFTLVQIKKYFQQSLAPDLKDFLQSGSSVDESSRLEGLLKLLSSDDIRKATRDFQVRIAADPGDESLEKAAFDYYVNVLSRLIGKEKAVRYVEGFLVNASPSERSKRLEPLKRLRTQIASAGQSTSLSSLLTGMCDDVEKGNYNPLNVMEKLKEIAEKVHIMQARYRDNTLAFKDAFDMARFMRQAFWAYFKALLEIESFIKDRDLSHLNRARLLSARADEMLGAMEAMLSGMKNLLTLHEDIEKI